MRLLLFGGTFDPPHLGHMGLLQNAIRAVEPALVLVIPAAVPPHKRASATPTGLRLAMCACFAPLFARLTVSDIEIGREGPSYSYDTLLELRRLYPGGDFYLTVGGDMLTGFTSWHRWRDLLAMATLVAQGRGEGEADLRRAAAELEAAGGRVIIAPGPVLPLSSTQIREGLAAGEDLYRLIPPPANEIAREHGLYTGGDKDKEEAKG